MMMLGFLLALGEAPQPAALFSDSMVLQRETRAPLWGQGAPGERVEVQADWEGAPTLAVEADEQGFWSVELETPAAGGPYRIRIRGGGGERVLEDVLVGEVWVASGQSNMEWSLGPRNGNGVLGWEEACRDATDPELRFFEVQRRTAPAPIRDLAGSWVAADPESARDFSAVAYFFARELREELGVPVGVIGSYWGGTPAEAWTRSGALGSFPEFADALDRQARYVANPEAAEAQWREQIERYWLRAYELDSARGLAGAEGDAVSDSEWDTVALPATWEQHGLSDFDGLAWYRRGVTVPEDWAGRSLVLELGAIDDRDTVYWNGERVGGHEQDGQWQKPRRYVVPAGLVRAGSNLLAVRVLDTGGLGGFSSPPETMRLALVGTDGALSLAGEWRWHSGTPIGELGLPPAREVNHAGSPSVLWNGMLAPLVPSAVAGVIWYQGESNVGRAAQYQRLFPAMITDWRAAFRKPELPFYYVQIAPFRYGGQEVEAPARLRDAQRQTLSLEHTGMVVTLDIGDPDDIHPLRKREVGERLALLALARTHGREVECSGPLYRSHVVEESALRIDFEHAAGLTSRGEPLRHITIAGADRLFHPAEARVQDGSLLVSSPAVPLPLAVRFGWGAADETNLWNEAGLPASSFRTDDWP